jgi:predicted transglutaminase-like cysteine proteinase
MIKRTAFVAALLMSALWSDIASSRGLFSQPEQQFAKEFGRARPPIGFVRFCVENPEECQAKGGKSERLVMDPDRWNSLYQVNTYVNGKIDPISDLELYGEVERWAFPIDAGDCEDYLLLKKRYLEGLGFPPEALLITVVLDERGEGHAILTVMTEQGEFILDNRKNDITLGKDTQYTFLKRQSQHDPRQWVALVKEKSVPQETASSGSHR